MWFRKKVILIPLVVALVLIVSITGVALAQDGSNGSGDTLLSRVAAILGIDQTKLEDAFTQAQKEMRAEALDNYLAEMVEQGKITQEEADQYKTWWNSRPDTLDKLEPGFGDRCGFHHGGGGFRIPSHQSTESTQ